MRWGLIARPETDRGLGIQTRAIADNCKPDFTFIMDVPDAERKWHKDFSYPGDTVTIRPTGENQLDMRLMKKWLVESDIQVLLTVEAWYDDGLIALCTQLGIKTINQMNPEFWRGWRDHPTEIWWPTGWWPLRGKPRPPGPVMPVPVPWVATDRWVHDGPLTFGHIVGKPAIYDRNGTRLFFEALHHSKQGVNGYLAAQEGAEEYERWIENLLGDSPMIQGFGFQLASSEERRSMYANFDVLVLPRRYGGLSLTVLEAMGSGRPVIMPDCPPNNGWPIVSVPWEYDQRVNLPVGEIQLVKTSARGIAAQIDEFARHPEALRAAQETTLKWARANSWEHWAPKYLERIEEVASR